MDAVFPRRDRSGPNLRSGQVIRGRYRVITRRGTGRLATVYLAEEVATANRVAVKVFHREFSKDEEFVSQLRRQAKLAAALSEKYPSIVAVYDCDRTDDGNLFVVMEYLDGRSLKDLIRQEGPLRVERVLRLTGQIAEALEAAHTTGLMHTDVRPHHVMVGMQGGEEAVKLKGFEVAGLRETGLVDQLIRADVIPGTPEYAAPEQIEGAKITPRTDVYSFGVVLYEMLTGDVPFRASTPDGVLAKHLQDAPPRLRGVRPEIPSVVERKVEQALEKEPEKRQRHVTDVINEHLYELAVDEMQMERGRRRYGVLWDIMATARGCLAGAREIATDPERAGARWIALGFTVWLVVVSASAVWMRSPPRMPAGEYKEAPALDLTAGGASEKEATEPSALSMREEPSSEMLRTTSIPKRTVRRPERTVAPTAAREVADLAAIAGTRSALQEETAGPEEDSPDPTAIIDWLLQQSSAKKR